MNQYYNPVRTIQGAGCIGKLPEFLGEMDLKERKVLFLVWSEQALPQSVFSSLQQPGQRFEMRTVLFQASNPTVEQLFETYEQTREFSPEVVVAVGGGSIMDVGKSLCCLYGKEIADTDALRELIRDKNYGSLSARWIGIPTTAGTGSEVTCWATIWDPAMDMKRSVEDQRNYAYAAFVDPQLAEGMPLKLAVSSALDAMAHGVESYWAKGTNCVSRALALQAVRIIVGNMEALLSGKKEAHDAMAKGSMLAGMAFSNTKTTACHSISYPLTMHYGIPHGAAVSMLLAPVLQMNASSVKDLDALMEALGAEDADMLKSRINSWLRRSGQPVSLQEWGVREEDLHRLAKLGMTKGRADNNPVEITTDYIRTILESIYPAQENKNEEILRGEAS